MPKYLSIKYLPISKKNWHPRLSRSKNWFLGVWYGMEDDFSIFHTGHFLPFHFHYILVSYPIFESLSQWATIKIHSAWKYQPLRFNDCKFVITPNIKLEIITPTAKNILQNYQKKVLTQKNNNKELSLTESKKINTNLCYDRRKSFVIWQIQCRRHGGSGEPCP